MVKGNVLLVFTNVLIIDSGPFFLGWADSILSTFIVMEVVGSEMNVELKFTKYFILNAGHEMYLLVCIINDLLVTYMFHVR